MYIKQSYVYKVVADCEIHADVYRPPDSLVRPVILWLHIGALIFGDRGTIHPDQLSTYLEAGYAVVSIDYRLAPEVKLGAIIDDLQDAYAWLRVKGPDLFRIDPERIAVIGHSAGGYLTLMAGFRLSPPPRALVSFYGYGDIIGAWYSRPDPFYCQQPAVPGEEAYRGVGSRAITGTSFEGNAFEGRYRFYVYCRQQGLWPKEVAGTDPDQDPAWFTPFCPIHNITPGYPPTLLIHGDQDTDVPCEQSQLMSRALEQHYVAHELIILPDRGHGFDMDGEGLKDPVVSGVFSRIFVFLAAAGM